MRVKVTEFVSFVTQLWEADTIAQSVWSPMCLSGFLAGQYLIFGTVVC